jgi:ribosomal RNA-processing protein 36
VQTQERGAVKDGKKPFYLKKSEQRRLELVAKYEELKGSGKLEKYLEKRRKKNAAKDHRYLPSTRRGGGGDGGGGK